MLRRVAFADLPRDPQLVRVLHHSCGGVLIAAVAYKPTSLSTSSSSSSAQPRAHTPLFFSVIEMAAPNEQSLPLRVVHVRVPKPYNAVHALALLRSNNGDDVYVVVQAAEVHAGQTPSSSTATFVYRRQIVVETNASNEDEDVEEAQERYELTTDLVSARTGKHPNESTTTATTGACRVRYQRLPRAANGAAGDKLWTAVAAFSTAETPIFGAINQQTAALNAGGPTCALITACVGAADAVDAVSATCPTVQLWTLTGTRVALAASCSLPALVGFSIEEIRTIAGTQNVALLRCQNSVFEMDLAALRGACAHFPHRVSTNAFLTRAWRLPPQARLTACAVKDSLLYAGTEDGCVVVWDLRQPTSTVASSFLQSGGSAFQKDQQAASQPQISASTKTPITGLYAPYATGFITCDASGAVRDWRERAEMAEEDEHDDGSAASHAPRATRGRAAHDGGNDEKNEEAAVEHGVLRDIGAAAAVSEAQFPYCARASAGSVGEGCVAMDGHDNFAAVVGESGRLSLYFCE